MVIKPREEDLTPGTVKPAQVSLVEPVAYQFQLSAKATLGVGYRYLYVNYRPGDFVFDTAMSGAMVGLNYSFK
ncbi:MAG: hypothetical protein ACJ746_26130 [Bryobacteraceae bacterium]